MTPDGHDTIERQQHGIGWISRVPSSRRHDHPVLFQQRMWLGAWCRGKAVLPNAGWENHAISLPGQAGSPRQRPAVQRAHQYLSLPASAAERLPTRPILTGHSVDGALTQSYLKHVGDKPPAAVLVASRRSLTIFASRLAAR